MKRRLKVYGIAIPIFLVLSLVLGAVAQFGGEMYRDSYYQAGAYAGFEVGYQYGIAEGYQYGIYAGYQYGLQEGYYYGVADGKTEGYLNTVMNWDNPWHQAALALEEELWFVDVAAVFRVSTNSEGNTWTEVWIYLAVPLYVTEEGTIAAYSLEDLDEVAPEVTAALVTMVKSARTDEAIVKITLMGTVDMYAPTIYFPYDNVSYEMSDVLAGAWEKGMRDEKQTAFQERGLENKPAAKNQFTWPYNPFYLAELQAAQEAQRSGSTTASAPK